MTDPAVPRKRPCASCPYRLDVPAGIWHPTEYAKLPAYDGDIGEQLEDPDQALRTFACHQADGRVCSGWLGHRDPLDMLAVRIGLSSGRLAPECADYTTDVPLFESGADAAAHGTLEPGEPKEPRTLKAIAKLLVSRGYEERPDGGFDLGVTR